MAYVPVPKDLTKVKTKVGFGGQRGNGCGGAGLAGFIVHRLSFQR
jgi:hypothetical protein